MDIEDSHSVTLQGFTINGGAQGILCSTASLCYLTGNTIQGPGRFGVNVIKGSRAFLESNVIEDWGRGAFIDSGAQVFSSNDVFQSNGGSALVVLAAAYFESLNSKFDNNGVGIDAGGTLTLRAVPSVATAAMALDSSAAKRCFWVRQSPATAGSVSTWKTALSRVSSLPA